MRLGRGVARDDTHPGRFKDRRPSSCPVPSTGLDGGGRADGPGSDTSSKSSMLSAIDFHLDFLMKPEPHAPS